MKRIAWAFALFFAGLSALWGLADTWWPTPHGYFDLRTVWVQYSGVLLLGAMSVAMVLSVRPAWLEPHLRGLDKMYRLHKWLGIAALVFGLVHWTWAKGTKWAVGWGWLERPARKPRPPLDAFTGFEGVLRPLRGLAESLGEWAFYAALVLMVLALVQHFPYRWFAKTHQFLALAYLVLVFHSVVLVQYAYWSQPIGWVLAVLLVAGTVSAVLVLLGRVGAQRKAQGQICALRPFPSLHMLEILVKMGSQWRGHQPGQFAFVTTDRAEGAHPYTIASAWNAQQPQLRFVTKALGDHTRCLPDLLKVGDTVTVEGPYGCFNFADTQARQIWIGAGIGITPFIGRLQYLTQQKPAPQQQIDLFNVTAVYEPEAWEQLCELARAAQVTLHVWRSEEQGKLSGEQLRQIVPDWQQASVWFCGPAAFGQHLARDLRAHGLAAKHFHQELFNMR